ncbi:MAG: hypothetical protein A2174_02665 [Candidatus Portnoybacteria bacterium RBG_13_41_18]|uniref:Cell envelope-related transcriptional attenuator domain-containing protein n=1 Tax=Candidatus Portnoybacteria bacterium RBG_13_41_18 TaxID=1801991 RepID=A0A1G2F8S9_9BACT|nr:MAG: hypothetical protein A2174_02665 [Candidatus Portnoybacteria bacterium RBG_13_41_18]
MEDKYLNYDSKMQPQKPRKKRRFWIGLIIILVIFVLSAGILFYKAGFTFSQMNIDNGIGVLPLAEDAPKLEKEQDRINILLLGLRGPGDPNGGLLTDTMMIVSIKPSTGQAAMISVPRDLYVKLPLVAGQKSPALKEKINFAYVYGEEKKQGAGLAFSKVAISSVTGLYIDYVVSADFTAFKEAVDILGGIDINLDKPFSENAQFVGEKVIDLPAGKNHLDGDTALYFVRSRYSTSDFDRARRQQQVLLAIKDKAFSLGNILNPVKIFELMGTMGRHIKTDMNLSDMNNLLNLSKDLELKDIKHKVFDTTEQGLLYSSISDSGAYILLPVGDNYDKIREACKNIFN